jgi:dTDP-glucose 4,6-dehydratase
MARKTHAAIYNGKIDMKTVLVTGGCGFIGANFIGLVSAETDWRIVNIDKLTYAGNPDNVGEIAAERYRFVHGDICDRALMARIFQEERPWGLVNFAAESHVDRSILDASPFLQTNIAGVHALLEVARSFPLARFLQVSTDEVYGDKQAKEASTEEAPLLPSSPYAASKAAADLLCGSYQRTYGVPIMITRSSNNYGPCQFPEKFIPLLIRNALQGLDLPVYGDGEQIRDWIYVEDNCRAILAVLEQECPPGIYNIGTGKERTNLEVVEAICAAIAAETGAAADQLKRCVRFVADRPGHDRRYAVESKKIRGIVDWRPSTSFEAGLKRTIRWYLDHGEWIRRVTSGEYRDYYNAVYDRLWGAAAKAQNHDREK